MCGEVRCECMEVWCECMDVWSGCSVVRMFEYSVVSSYNEVCVCTVVRLRCGACVCMMVQELLYGIKRVWCEWRDFFEGGMCRALSEG